ncbi:hypothetical protein [Butyrivibrio sp. INlla21]|uniref:hypothetical protein n=1 Tax=Butyrivibrio sp. INlla21 TaxID=1520811 RepID=UPI0008F39A05|nr:hypothetical protein [Butyrivibrio sp. INlla21]SFU31999.1 hypothetical protein SAMN02910342_00058 [Butyrivibrio sp. INlla21]
MGKDWDYANLTHDAKEAGGPGNYIDKVHKDGQKEGLLIGLLTTLTALFAPIIIKHVKKTKEDKKIATEKLSEYLEREDEEEKDNE